MDILTNFALSDLIGSVGTLMVGLAYLFTQTGIMSSDDLSFPVINLLGSCLIVFSLMHNFNFASAMMELFWIIISLIGIARHFLARRKKPD